MHNLYPVLYHRSGHRYAARAAPADRALHPLGLDRSPPLRPGRVGRRPDHRLGVRRPAFLGHSGTDDGPVGHLALGLGHRRLLHAVRGAADARAAGALDPVRRRLGGDAHEGGRDRRSPRPSGRRSGSRGRCRSGGATRSSAPSCTRTSAPPTASTGGPACRSCATSPSPTRGTGGPWPRTSPAVRPRPARGAGRPPRAATAAPVRPARPLGRLLALGPLRARHRRPRPRPRAGVARRARRDAAGAARRAAAARARRGRCCRSCRPTWTRSPPTAPAS